MLQHDQCIFCDWPINDPAKIPDKKERDADPLLATIEHMEPKSRGGKGWRAQNIRLSCRTCNQKKGNRSEGEFLSDFARWLMFRRADAPVIHKLKKQIEEPPVDDAILIPPPAVVIPADLPLDIDVMAAKLAPTRLSEDEAEALIDAVLVEEDFTPKDKWAYENAVRDVMADEAARWAAPEAVRPIVCTYYDLQEPPPTPPVTWVLRHREAPSSRWQRIVAWWRRAVPA